MRMCVRPIVRTYRPMALAATVPRVASRSSFVGAAGLLAGGSLFMGGLGLLAGIIAQKFDQMAAITNFIVTPLSFLSGTFYSVEALPEPFRTLSHWNPIFYLIDGLRYGFAGASDAPPLRGLT